MERISKLKAYILIKDSKGLIFNVVFKKQDGSTRVMTARLGVTKGVTGKGMSWTPELREKLAVFDIQKGEYRMINLDRLMGLTIKGKDYVIGTAKIREVRLAKLLKTEKVFTPPTVDTKPKTVKDAMLKAAEIAKSHGSHYTASVLEAKAKTY